ncbi:hypothetical protein BaRGS_00038372 [Batillaria attramentaria]|uniref:Carboxylic ester hydrolase n=1 Tax=Batillaria attramentaria TaxID=370345 RepID=A0ABD0J6V2_9CAEN
MACTCSRTASFVLRLTWLLCLFLFSARCQAQSVQRVTYTTPSGKVTGRMVTVSGETVYQFLGVPFAEPPIGQLRFKKPVPVRPWNVTLNATEFAPSCPQPGWGADMGIDIQHLSEDCLYLNIYTKVRPTQARSSSDLKTVMVWIHGGGFSGGGAMGFDGSLMAVRGDVVVVAINYRLGMLGWMSTLDDVSPGNYGQWDQRQALLWVRDNIAAFGGDPGKVTIFGESAGGYSVGLHALSPLNMGLFQRAVMQSGTALNLRTTAPDPVGFAKRVARILGCNDVDHGAMMSCVKGKTVADIQSATLQASESDTLQYVLHVAPVVDGELVKEDPRKLLGEDYRDQVPFWTLDVMVGTTNAEGSLVLTPLQPWQEQLKFDLMDGIPTRVLCANISTALSRDYYDGSEEVARAICRQYTSDKGDEDQARNVVDMYGDMMFQQAAVETRDLHVKGKYVFSHMPVATDFRRFPWFRGAAHGAEVNFLVGQEHVGDNETVLSNAMIDGWTNFAKFGRGTFQWPEYDLTTRAYTDLDQTISVKQNLYPDRMDFWLRQIPAMLSGTDNSSNGAGFFRSSCMMGRSVARPCLALFSAFALMFV